MAKSIKHRNISSLFGTLFFILLFLSTTSSILAQIDDRDEIFRTPPPRIEKNLRYTRVQDFSVVRTDTILLKYPEHDLSTFSPQDLVPGRYDFYTLQVASPRALGKLVLSLSNADSLFAFILVDLAGHRRELLVQKTPPFSRQAEFVFPTRLTKNLTLCLRRRDDQITITDFALYEVQTSSDYRVMVVGNSITAGKFADDGIGYRKVLYDDLKAHESEYALPIDFVGPYGDPPYEGYFDGGRKIDDFYPQSLGGQGRADITATMDNPLYTPNLMTIHLGTNDISDQTQPVAPYDDGNGFADTETGQMATLVNYLLNWHDGTFSDMVEKIVVSQIIPQYPYRDANVVEFNIELLRMVSDFQIGYITGEPEPVYLCDQYSWVRGHPHIWEDNSNDPLYTPLYPDNDLHPNTEGHNAMGHIYFHKVHELLGGGRPLFTDITWEAGVYGFDHEFGFQGLAIASINADRYGDIYSTRTAPNSPLNRDAFWISADPIPFDERAEEYQIDDIGASRGVLFADIDNDGDLDLFNGRSPGPNQLYRNDNNVSFTNITASASLANENNTTTGVAAFDAENDGDVDLFALNLLAANEFYLNDGSGFFQRVDQGLWGSADSCMSVSAADFDNDGDVDLFIAKRAAASQLLLNDGTGIFSDATFAAGIHVNDRANSATWVDLNNDGFFDLTIAVSMSSENPSPLLRVFANNGDGTFAEKSNAVNIFMDGHSAAFADLDNDHDIDILTMNESDSSEYYQNLGEWHFAKTAPTGAVLFAGSPRGALSFDVDLDGDVDILAARARSFNQLLRTNTVPGLHFFQASATGPNGNAVGYGTRFQLYESGELGNSTFLIGYDQLLSANGYATQPSHRRHFGLGQRTTFDLLTAFTDGSYAAMRNLDVDQNLTIRPHVAMQPAGAPTEIVIESGDNQIGANETMLAEPLIVRVKDARGKDVPEAQVAFTVVRGDADIFLPSDTLMWLEAENAKRIGHANLCYDATASGDAFVFADHPDGMIELPFSLHQAGVYYLWARMWNANGTSLLSVHMDEGDSSTLSISETDDWVWQRLGSESHPIAFYLTLGAHNINVSIPSENVHLDKILVTQDKDFVPIGSGGDDKPVQLTDRMGITRRIVRLGDTAGPVMIKAQLHRDNMPVQGAVCFFHAEIKQPLFFASAHADE
jgi:hypothetical protein